MTRLHTPTEQRRLVEALAAHLGHPGAPARLIETHISFVLLTGVFAYKIKKAVDLGFVDYTSLEKRRFFCEEELRLNRRLATGLYLEALPLYGSPEAPGFEEGGEPIEWAVKMHEFDQDRLFDRLISANGLSAQQLGSLAERLAAFHEQADRADPVSSYGSSETVWAAVQGALESLPRSDRIEELEGKYLADFNRLEEQFSKRKAEGFVRECHGDLHLGNLVLQEDGPTGFDGIEFNPELRWIDIMSDLAFLSMDLTAHGRPDLAFHLLNRWLEETGDYEGLALLRFYETYRALVRAKVARLLGNDSRMEAYLDQAEAGLSEMKPALIITHGLSGSGKTTLARRVSESLKAICLRSDVERKRLHGLAPLARSRSGLETGLYTEAEAQKTYGRLSGLAERALDDGYPVIVDAACLKLWQRDLFKKLARKRSIPFLILDCRASLSALRKRIGERQDDASEATQAVLELQTRTVEPLNPEEKALSMEADTSREAIEAILPRITKRLGSG